jgi:stage V sporulation protein B
MTERAVLPPSWMPKIVKESSIHLVGSVIGTVLNYVLLVTITRYLDPGEFGSFAVAQSVMAVAMVFVLFGTPRALDRFIPQYLVNGELGKVRGLILGIVRLALVFSVAVAIVLIAASRFLTASVFHNVRLLPVLRLMVISLPALAWIEIVATSFAGFGELRYRVYTHQLSLPLSKIGLALPVLSLGLGLLGWVWAYLLSLVFTSALAWWFFRRRIWGRIGNAVNEPADFSGVVSYCWPLSVNNLVMMLSGHVGVLLLGAYRPESDAGIYRVYVYLVLLLVLVRTSFMQIYKPVAAGLISGSEGADVIELHKRVSKWMLIAGSFVGLALLLLGTDLLAVLVPEGYRSAVSALMLLAAARTLVAVMGPQGMTLEAFGNTRLSMLNALLMLAVNVGLGRLLIPSHGVLGAAAALAAAVVLAACAELAEVYLLHRLHPFGNTYFRSLAVALVAGIAMYLLRTTMPTPGPVRMGVLFSGLVAFYAVGLSLSGSLDAQDRALLAAIRGKLRRR